MVIVSVIWVNLLPQHKTDFSYYYCWNKNQNSSHALCFFLTTSWKLSRGSDMMDLAVVLDDRGTRRTLWVSVGRPRCLLATSWVVLRRCSGHAVSSLSTELLLYFHMFSTSVVSVHFYFVETSQNCAPVPLRRSALLKKAPKGPFFSYLTSLHPSLGHISHF